MKKIFLFGSLLAGTLMASAQGLFTWIGGDKEKNQPGIYKQKGVLDLFNKPGARYLSVNWTDQSGNQWIFGGYGFASNGSGNLGDMWKRSNIAQLWAWTGGENTVRESGDQGNHGLKGIASAQNRPAARNGATGWTDASNNLWLFGGDGYYNRENLRFNDLWKYNISAGQWTWVSGDTASFQAGVYDIKGTISTFAKPGSRTQSASWTDAAGNLWLFGGNGTDENAERGLMNDLWRFDPVLEQWAWVSGSKVIDQAGTYGVKGTAAPENTPGSRTGALSWTDASGNFWLFGGVGYAGASSGYLNDLWKFDPETLLWTWVSGDSASDEEDVFGIKGQAAPGNKPGGRAYASTWVGRSGNLYLFGGLLNPGSGHDVVNDIWSYDISRNMWTWETGEKGLNLPGEYGIKGRESENNKPGSRLSPLSWTDFTGTVYFFGGSGFGSGANYYLNDVWRYVSVKDLLPL